jgi:transcription antitermination protein NusB
MATRRQAREWAFQLLFQLDANPQDPQKAFRVFWKEHKSDQKARMFAEMLVEGVHNSLEEIDTKIVELALNWDIKRMGNVERNVMRMAIFEMMNFEDIPAAVTINEAVDIAKYFGSNESGKFVNGILDRARKELRKDDAQDTRESRRNPATK